MVKSAVDAYQNGGTIYRWVIGILVGLMTSAMFGFIAHSELNDRDGTKNDSRIEAQVQVLKDQFNQFMQEVRGNQKVIMYRLDEIDKK